MWRDIILYNKKSILKCLIFLRKIYQVRDAIENNDDKFLLNLFTKQKIRKDIIK